MLGLEALYSKIIQNVYSLCSCRHLTEFIQMGLTMHPEKWLRLVVLSLHVLSTIARRVYVGVDVSALFRNCGSRSSKSCASCNSPS